MLNFVSLQAQIQSKVTFLLNSWIYYNMQNLWCKKCWWYYAFILNGHQKKYICENIRSRISSHQVCSMSMFYANHMKWNQKYELCLVTNQNSKCLICLQNEISIYLYNYKSEIGLYVSVVTISTYVESFSHWLNLQCSKYMLM